MIYFISILLFSFRNHHSPIHYSTVVKTKLSHQVQTTTTTTLPETIKILSNKFNLNRDPNASNVGKGMLNRTTINKEDWKDPMRNTTKHGRITRCFVDFFCIISLT